VETRQNKKRNQTKQSLLACQGWHMSSPVASYFVQELTLLFAAGSWRLARSRRWRTRVYSCLRQRISVERSRRGTVHHFRPHKSRPGPSNPLSRHIQQFMISALLEATFFSLLSITGELFQPTTRVKKLPRKSKK